GAAASPRPRLDQAALTPFALDAQLVALVGGLPKRGEPLERGAELLLEAVALSGDRFALRRVPLLLLGQAEELVGGRGLRFGELVLDTPEFRSGEVVLLLQPA